MPKGFIEPSPTKIGDQLKKLLLPAILALSCCALVEAQTGFSLGLPKPKPQPAGFYGQSLFYHSAGPIVGDPPPTQGVPYQTFVSVYDTDGKLVNRVASNRVGQFYSFLKPAEFVYITVKSNQLTAVAIVYSQVE